MDSNSDAEEVASYSDAEEVDSASDAEEVDSASDAEEVDSPSDGDDMDSPCNPEDMDTEILEPLCRLADGLKLLKMLTKLKEMQGPKVNPPCPIPKLSGAQWLELNMRDHNRCYDNLRMSSNAFLRLHNILEGGFGLKSTSKCNSKEALAMFIWICGHGGAVREAKDRFERSLDTISRKCSHIAEIMLKWSNTVLVPTDPEYKAAHIELKRFAPHFDGCIGAIDGTHIPVEVKRHRKNDHINRKHYASINVCAIVDMHGLFTYVGSGMVGSCHDMRVLDECMSRRRFPTPPKGRYYLADSGYANRDGYMVPFQGNRLHLEQFEGVPIASLGKEEKFNWCHASLRNVIERRFGNVKEKWHILDGMPLMKPRKQAIMIIACFAMDNYLWRRHFGEGETYPLSPFFELTKDMSTPALRELTATLLYDPPNY